MKRYHITLGASTTAGGKVITASSCCSIDGVKVALEGDKIICPACKSQGSIRIPAASAEEVASTARRDIQAAAIGDSKDKVILRFLDEFSQAPIAAKRYRLELVDKIIEGQTDADGYSEPIDAADRNRLLAWRILE